MLIDSGVRLLFPVAITSFASKVAASLGGGIGSCTSACSSVVVCLSALPSERKANAPHMPETALQARSSQFTSATCAASGDLSNIADRGFATPAHVLAPVSDAWHGVQALETRSDAAWSAGEEDG